MLQSDAPTTPQRPIRVLVVDDSPFIRHILTKYLEAEPAITIVGEARDGLQALSQIKKLTPDVVTLDVEMPRMNGLEALQQIMTSQPTPVVMLSALTQRGARTTIQSLMYGAVDFVPKPSESVGIYSIIDELIDKIKIAAGTTPSPRLRPATSPLGPSAKASPRPFRSGDPLIVVGTSTGGPRALRRVLSELPVDLPAALVVVQHMPPGFTGSLAQRLNDSSPLIVQEAAHGDRLARGLVLMAPGGFHLRFQARNKVFLDEGPRRNNLRPAVDVSMESAANLHGPAVLGVVLTGMGSDGTEGASHIKAANGHVIAEDRSTSVVYGMPRSVIEAGLADRVVPLPDVASTIVELIE